MTGVRFNRLEILGFAGFSPNQQPYVKAKCDCGKVDVFNANHILSGKTTSCRCAAVAFHTKRLTKHGFAPLHGKRKPEYHTWQGIKGRCYDKNNSHYHCYGGKGVIVCPQWLGPDGFIQFLKDMGPRPEGGSIERVDPYGNYCPENCKWIPMRDQAKNRRYNWKVRAKDGTVYTARDICRMAGVGDKCLNTVMLRKKLDKEAVHDVEDLQRLTSVKIIPL